MRVRVLAPIPLTGAPSQPLDTALLHLHHLAPAGLLHEARRGRAPRRRRPIPSAGRQEAWRPAVKPADALTVWLETQDPPRVLRAVALAAAVEKTLSRKKSQY